MYLIACRMTIAAITFMVESNFYCLIVIAKIAIVFNIFIVILTPVRIRKIFFSKLLTEVLKVSRIADGRFIEKVKEENIHHCAYSRDAKGRRADA